MTTDFLWMMGMMVLFAVFLRGLLQEASNALRSIARDEKSDEWRDELQEVVALRARRRLRDLRASTVRHAMH